MGDEDTPPELELFQTAYLCWEHTLENFRFKSQQLFQHIELVDPWRADQSETVTTWCPVTDFVASKHKLQRSLNEDRFSRALSHLEGHKYSKGATITAPYLWEARQDPELIAAILLEASLFARMGNSRIQYPRDYWPPIEEVRESRDALRHVIQEQLQNFNSWPRMCTDVLPVRCEDSWYKMDDTYSLWHYLAEEHAMLYSQYRVLKIDFVEKESRHKVSSAPSR